MSDGLECDDPEPLASGSIAQIHRAGRRVRGEDSVLKIQRPGISELYDMDLRLLAGLTRFLQKLPRMQGFPIYAALNSVFGALRRQMDFKAEAECFRQFSIDFQSFPNIIIPRTHDDLCRDNVIALVYIPNLKRL